MHSQIPVSLEDAVCGDVTLKVIVFLCDMVFLTDITSHLNNVKTKLQGTDQTMCDLYAHRKISVLNRAAQTGIIIPSSDFDKHFPACAECERSLHKYKADIERLHSQFTMFTMIQTIPQWIKTLGIMSVSLTGLNKETQ